MREMPLWFKRLWEDVGNYDLVPDDAFECLVKCELKHGERVYWYFKDNAEFAKELGLDVRKEALFSGIVIGFDGKTADGRELDLDDCVVVVDRYPTEKCFPEISWISLGRLLATPDLVEVYQLGD